LAWWHIPIIPATEEADIKKMNIQGQYGTKISETLSQHNKPATVVGAYKSKYMEAVGKRITV
jgi:hypothetical protein